MSTSSCLTPRFSLVGRLKRTSLGSSPGTTNQSTVSFFEIEPTWPALPFPRGSSDADTIGRCRFQSPRQHVPASDGRCA